MEQGDGAGLVVAMYAPAVVKYTLGNGVDAMLSIQTDYPFSDTVEIDANCGKGMLLSLRIPSWTLSSTVVVNGTEQTKSPSPGGWSLKWCLDLLLSW